MGVLDLFKRSKKKPQRRNYQAAAKGRLFADFTGSNRSADSEIRWALEELRNRSRDLERNNEYFRRYLQLLRTNVVGNNGFRLQVRATNADGTQDVPGSQMIEAAWAEFSRLGGPTVDGKMSLIDLENHVITGMARDGEVFTPAPNGTFLAGITRARHIKHLKDMGIPIHETVLSFDDFYAADEVFMTGNMQKITPVTAIEETHFQIGPIAGQLKEAYWDWALSTSA